jgi:hypothetical protein
MTGKNKGKLIVISNLTEQCKTDCIPGRKRTSSHDVDFDKSMAPVSVLPKMT